jgi:hypothetical protein
METIVIPCRLANLEKLFARKDRGLWCGSFIIGTIVREMDP